MYHDRWTISLPKSSGEPTTVKNGSDIQVCIEEESLILPEETVLLQNPTIQQKKMWDLRAAALVKNEDTLRQNMCSLYADVLSLCDPTMKDKISNHKDFKQVMCTKEIAY